MALIDNYTEKELRDIVANCVSFRDLKLTLGYTTSGNNTTTIKKRLDELKIDYSHFSSQESIKRTKENIFIENSTATQATLRRWYVKGQYTPYICSICGQEPFWQGKDLTLILDHINGNNRDDRVENLRWVCPNCNQQLDTTGFKGTKEKNYCIDCGREISKRSKRCIFCSHKKQSEEKIVKLENMPVTRDELKSLIRTQSFVQIGNKFGVSDNAIRKWCDKFNLPRTKKIIQNYSDKDWENI